MPGRVRTRRQFAQLADPSTRGRSGPLRISFVEGPTEDQSVAVAFAISRKVGNAVTRNRIRRRLRALMDNPPLSLRPGMYLIRCDIEAGKLNYDELHHHLRAALERL